MYVDRFNIPSVYLTGHFPVGFLVCGLAVVAFGIIVLLRMVRFDHFAIRRIDQETMRFFQRLALIPIGISLIVFSFVASNRSRTEAKNLLIELHASELKIAEGTVKVYHVSPGHDAGDIIQIADRSFRISGSRLTPFYHKTIEEGGILTEGREVRVYFLANSGKSEELEDSKIIRIQEKIKQD